MRQAPARAITAVPMGTADFETYTPLSLGYKGKVDLITRKHTGIAGCVFLLKILCCVSFVLKHDASQSENHHHVVIFAGRGRRRARRLRPSQWEWKQRGERSRWSAEAAAPPFRFLR